jgi:tRNA(Arg) A34 adenosine deaminase TadA
MSAGDPARMREAIALALEGVRSGAGGPFGALVVRDGRVLGRGCNRVTSANDPTAHAEIVALRAACAAAGSFALPGAELYTSCEPCPMCLGAIWWARIACVFYAGTRADAAAAGFDDAALYEEVARPLPARTLPLLPLLRDEARAAFVAWGGKADRVRY